MFFSRSSFEGKVLDDNNEIVKSIAGKYSKYDHAIYLGRDTAYPAAMEGALKLKEISYIHAEGYAAGELKHGPIALIDEHIPVVVVAPPGEDYKKIMSNLQEVKARGADILGIGRVKKNNCLTVILA